MNGIKYSLFNVKNQIQLSGMLITCILGALFFCLNVKAEEDPGKIKVKSQKYQSFDPSNTIYQLYLKNVGIYQPIYFLLGTNPQKSKFQFSFKYQFYNMQKSASAGHQ